MNQGTRPKMACSTRGAPRTLSRCTAWVNSCTSSKSSQALLSSRAPVSGGARKTPILLKGRGVVKPLAMSNSLYSTISVRPRGSQASPWVTRG